MIRIIVANDQDENITREHLVNINSTIMEIMTSEWKLWFRMGEFVGNKCDNSNNYKKQCSDRRKKRNKDE